MDVVPVSRFTADLLVMLDDDRQQGSTDEVGMLLMLLPTIL